ncbi:MAG: energy-coupling factor transporter ATPase [Selenomonadaceae bacterium]|nr:energy-coupling factor transporter ATPase [Selenomonadaceae bacterium]
MNIIEISRLTYVYAAAKENTPALNGINLNIGEGEFVAIVGANGSGKSTLARHLNALLLPTEGTCKVMGLDTARPENLWDIRRQVGLVFQNPDNQLVAAIVEDEVAFGPENLGLPPAEIRLRVDKALQAVGLTEQLHFAPHLLSGGQKQRLAIAGALAMEPKCLVLDEATAMLDPQGREEVMQVARDLREQGLTLICITHFMEEAALADRVVVMHQGKIVAQGTPKEILAATDLAKWGLEPPLATEIADRLRRRGLNLPRGICREDELVATLCP